MSDSKPIEKRPPGRPRGFDRDEALRRAAGVFWAKGYEGASFRDLTEAMGIGPPSLCAAFGDKRRLFLEAVDRYAAEGGQALHAALCATGDLAVDLRAAFGTIIGRSASEAGPSGCLLACVLPDAAEGDAAARERLAGFLVGLDSILAKRFAAAGFPAEVALTRASIASATMHSLALRARAGLARCELERLADGAVSLLAMPDRNDCAASLRR